MHTIWHVSINLSKVVPDTNQGIIQMIKKVFVAGALVASLAAMDIKANTFAAPFSVCMAPAPNDGTYTKTSYSVSIYTESGHPVGVYAVYLHHGKHYINFRSTWICIQGKSRFGYSGNWYVIK